MSYRHSSRFALLLAIGVYYFFINPTTSSAIGNPVFPNINRCQSGVIDNSFCVEAVSEEGKLFRRSPIVQRDGGAAGLIGPWLLWTFGDTFGPYQAPNGEQRTYTAALSPPNTSSYRNLVDQTEGVKAPKQFVPLTQNELNFNFCARATVSSRPAWCNSVTPYPPRMQCDLSMGTCTNKTTQRCSQNNQCSPKCTIWGVCSDNLNKACTLNSQCSPKCALDIGLCIDDPTDNCKADVDCKQRIVLWPTRPIEVSSTNCENRSSPNCQGEGAVFYNKFLTKCIEFCYDWVEAGVSRITLKANEIKTEAVREATPVFTKAAGDRAWEPVIQENNWVYFMSDGHFARVKKTQLSSRSKYEYWVKGGNSGQWSTNQSAATKDPKYAGGDTIAWNPYLKRYLSAKFTNGDGIFVKFRYIYLQSAKNIQGPWSDPIAIIDTLPFPDVNNYYAELHPEISGLGGREMRVTWVKNNTDDSQDIVAQKITLLNLEDYSTCGTISAPTHVSRGQRFFVAVNIKNTGKRSWANPDYELLEGSFDGSFTRWGFGNVALPVSPVAPGSTATFGFYATTPANFRSGASVTVPLRLRHKESKETIGKSCKFVMKIN